jgi:transposase-like protein
MSKVVEIPPAVEIPASPLDTLFRDGARKMLHHALELEVAEYLERHAQRDVQGRALVVRNGTARPRPFTTGIGTFEVEAPRVNDKRVIDGERQKFTSSLLPAYMRKTPTVTSVLPILYLRGLSTSDFKGALESLLGKEATGLSASAITRLTQTWQGELAEWKKRSLSEVEYVYVWVDGIHFNVRLEDERLAALVVIGVRPDGTKEVIALDDGYRESAESWAALLRDLKKRGMKAPRVAVGDGALGFWAALRDVWPETKEQRCWVHKEANVLDKLPKSQQVRAKEMFHKMMYAPTRAACDKARDAFEEEFGKKCPKSMESLKEDWERMVTHFDFPVEHWLHLRTTNPIESTFATVRLRTRVTKGPGSRAAGMAMAFKLLLMASQTWRKLTSAELLPQVQAGVKFVDGKRVERDEESKSQDRKVAA